MGKRYNYVRKTAKINGKRLEAYGKTEREAILKLSAKIEAVKRGEDATSGAMTVDTWFEQWLETYKKPKGLTSKYIRTYQSIYRMHIMPYIGKLKLKDVKSIHLQKVMNLQSGASYSRAKKVRGLLREMFTRAHQSRLIPYDPSEMLEMPSTKEGKRRSITESERMAILKVAKWHKSGLWILTLLYTGMRPGETAALTWGDVDFTRNEIHVHAARESGTVNVKTPKTLSGIRDIPIHAKLLPLLKAESAGKSPEAWVFPGYAGKIADDRTMRRWWLSFKRRVDIEMGADTYRNRIVKSSLLPGLTVYCLRHTFCTDLQRAGVPLTVAKDLMGHASISVTANIYTHRDSAMMHDGIAALDGTAGGKNK